MFTLLCVQKGQIFKKEKAINFIDTVVERGCLFLNFTGGEIFLNPDFPEIYTHAIKKGCVITLFTNGALLDDATIDLLSKYKPYLVEITLYGFSEETYLNVTGTKNFRKVIRNVYKLKENNIKLYLKTFVLNENYDDFFNIREFAIKEGIKFGFDSLIVDSMNSPTLKYQLPIEKMLSLEKYHKDDSMEKEGWVNIHQFLPENRLIHCGSGRYNAFLSVNNDLLMCNMLHEWKYSLDEYTFDEAWKNFEQYLNLEDSSDCRKCELRKKCRICPGRSLLMTGSIQPRPCFPICDFCYSKYRKK
ncbi:radical SAM protein [Holdemania massiliensis]|uniref:radical SAM protein n=1 Tax=Holdemania massiliensis TaxID=1468449 RepID=UPI0002F0C5F9|nr:radical SAM protein [Holdemania massiliensis]